MKLIIMEYDEYNRLNSAIIISSGTLSQEFEINIALPNNSLINITDFVQKTEAIYFAYVFL